MPEILEPLLCSGRAHVKPVPTARCVCGKIRPPFGYADNGDLLYNVCDTSETPTGDSGWLTTTPHPDEITNGYVAPVRLSIHDTDTGNVYDAAALVEWDRAGRVGPPPVKRGGWEGFDALDPGPGDPPAPAHRPVEGGRADT